MHHVVQDVERECARDDTVRHPVGEDRVRKFGERRLEGGEEQRRHDKAHPVHLQRASEQGLGGVLCFEGRVDVRERSGECRGGGSGA